MKAICLLIAAILFSTIPSYAQTREMPETVKQGQSLAHYMMGVIYDLNGLAAPAVYEYEKAIEWNPTSYAPHLRVGANYARLGRLEDAAQQLELVSVLNPDDLQSHYLLALIYSTQKKFDKAAFEYESILKSFSESDPQNIEIYAYLGQLYYSLKKFDQAAEQFEKILKIEPNNPDIFYMLGSLYLDAEKKEKAIQTFKKALEIEPEHDGCLNSLAYVYAQDDVNLDEALSLINRALVIDPNNGAYLDTLGWIYFQKGKYIEALKALKKADNFYKDSVIYDHIGDVYARLNQPMEARKYWRKSLELKPSQTSILKKLDQLDKTQALNNNSPHP